MAHEREFEIDLEDDELEAGEQVLEDEANKMLKSWDREQLLKEIQDKSLRTERDEKALADIYNGDTDFDDIIKTMTPLDTAGRDAAGNENVRQTIFLKVLEPNAAGKKIKPINTILFDIIGYLEHELQPFESSIHDGKPKKLNLMEGPVVPGLLVGFLELREGERANIMVRSEMAFGPLGSYGGNVVIPGDATILYHVKVFKVWDESQLDEILEYERINYLDIPLEEKLPVIEEHKRVGNEYLRDGEIKDAVVKYKLAIKELEDGAAPAMLNSSQRLRALLVTLLQNSAIAYNKLGMHKTASKMAKRALYYESNCIKAHYQLIKARLALNDQIKAERYLEQAKTIFPDNSEFDALKLELNQRCNLEKQKRDEIAKRMAQAYK